MLDEGGLHGMQGIGLAEALERPDRTFCLAVQWHPEGDPRSAVIGALVEAGRSYAAARPDR